MADFTTRLALRKPDPDPITGDDVDAALDINANMDKIDAAVGCAVCTSGTRPGSPFQGQLIFETDTGKVLVYNGSTWKHIISINTGSGVAWTGDTTITGNLTVSGSVSKGVTGPTRNIYTANATWTKPTGLVASLVQVQASGASGGGAPTTGSGQASLGSGGGAGGYSESLILAGSLAATVAVTVGAAAAGVSGANGNNGNTSSFGAHCVAAGGAAGIARTAGNIAYGIDGGAGGTVSAGDIQVPGEPGMPGWGDGNLGFSGTGGSSRFGAGGRARITTTGSQSFVGNAGTGYGSGGGGAICSASAAAATGGASPTGIVVVTNFF